MKKYRLIICDKNLYNKSNIILFEKEYSVKIKGLKKALCLSICAFMLTGLFPVTSNAAVNKLDAYDAYYDFLQEEADRIGQPIRDNDYYNMFTDKIQRNSKVEKILAAHLLDVTNDGVEELILKRYITNNSGALLDPSDTEWICIYTYENGELRRIGQNLDWAYSAGNGSWGYYEPEGYIGYILSSHNYPYISDECIYYCKNSNGKVYLADLDPDSLDEVISFYSYNGTLMERSVKFHANFVPYYVGSVASSYGRYLYEVNGTQVSKNQYYATKNAYISGGYYELRNNDYNAVLNTLSNAIQSYYIPSSWAEAEVNKAISNDYVPEQLQKGYTEAISRAEFCALATQFCETYTGKKISERMEFTDTNDVNVQKMGAVGVVNGTGDGAFSPNKNLTRQEAATILARLADYMDIELENGTLAFADNGKISSWAKDSVARISASGIMNGVGNNTFDPLSSYTREQAILTIIRLDK
ncbi:MAG: S-layer homology domain-containing protein [Clostridiales bacterium]|nr:S-layer homology domain-containing protein [Clostridiales bacterium]